MHNLMIDKDKQNIFNIYGPNILFSYCQIMCVKTMNHKYCYLYKNYIEPLEVINLDKFYNNLLIIQNYYDMKKVYKNESFSDD